MIFFVGNLEMAMANLIIITLLSIEMDLIGIMVKEITMVADLEDLVITILKDLLTIEVEVLMVLIVLQMEGLNLKEVDGLQKIQTKIGMGLLKNHLQI